MRLKLLWGYEACIKVVRRGKIFRLNTRVMEKKYDKLINYVRKTSHTAEISLGLQGVNESD